MSCTRISDWFSAGDDPTCSEIPESLKVHASMCRSCKAQLAALESFIGQERSVEPPPELIPNLRQEVLRRLPSASRDPSSGAPSWPSWGLSFQSLGFACAVILATFAVAFHLARAPGIVPHQGSLSEQEIGKVSGGNGVLRSSSGSRIPLSPSALAAFPETGVQLGKPGAHARIEFASGWTIQTRGTADLVLEQQGISVKDGVFAAEFRRGANPFLVRVPCAIIEITGTEIFFNLASGTGFMQLVSGKAKVTPVLSSEVPFDWPVGKRILIMDSGILFEPATSALPAENLRPATAVSILK